MRIGFILASIHTGSSLNVWPAVARQARLCSDTLFTFPGGRLGRQTDFEYLRNSVYAKAGSQMIDGLVIWGSSLSGTVGTEEVRAFCEKYQDKPLVTISSKTGDNPDVSFESYFNLKRLVIHMIRIHGARRIVFIRGPLNHFSSEARYKAYRDALKEEGVAFDRNLVTDPNAWNEGDKSISQILDERHLLGGKDFDTVIAASDLMAFSAARRLEAEGYVIPDDVRIGSFNDSLESRMMKVPASTVHMPYYQIGNQSYSILKKRMEGQHPDDMILDSPIVLRNSCGCSRNETVSRISCLKDLEDRLANVFWLNGLNIPPLKDFLSGKNVRKIAQRMFTDLVAANADLFDMNALMVFLRTCEFVPENVRAFACDEAALLLCETQSRAISSFRYESITRAKILNSLKCDLLCLQNASGIASVLKRHIPALGIHEAFIVLEQENGDSSLIAYYTDDEVGQEPRSFSSSKLLPQDLMENLKHHLYVVQPLFIENQSLGYAVVQTDTCDGTILEELRSTISSSLNSAMLFEQTNKAKDAAEKAQQERNELFANVAELLEDSLGNVKAGLADNLVFDEKKRKELQQYLVDATYMMNLALSKVGGLELNLRFLNPSGMLETVAGDCGIPYHSSSALPAVRGDEAKLSDCLKILVEYYISRQIKPEMLADFDINGLRITIILDRHDVSMADHLNDPDISYVRSIFQLHAALLSVESGRCMIRIPFTDISGQTVPCCENPVVIKFSPQLDVRIPGCEVLAIPVSELVSHMPGTKAGALAWDAKDAGFEDEYALRTLKETPEFSHLAFLCFNCPGGVTMDDVLQKAVQSEQKGPVLLLGAEPEGFNLWAPSNNVIEAGDFEKLKFLVQQTPASLIVSTKLLSVRQLNAIRGLEGVSCAVILLVSDSISLDYLSSIEGIPKILLSSPSITASEEFSIKIRSIICGTSMLPALTGSTVKKAQIYLSCHVRDQLSRWQVAEAVHVSEDYLTRIFKKELGISPWDYLNRCRIYLATRLLKETTLSINEVAGEAGFTDQAYFCRVFKKITGSSPGKIRSRKLKQS